MKRPALTFTLTAAVTVAVVLVLHAVGVRLNLGYALLLTLGALIVRELSASGFAGSPSPEFPRVLYRATPELEAAKDRRVRRIEDDLFRTIETKRQGPRLPATYLSDIARELETLATTRGEDLALAQQTSDLISLAHEGRSRADAPDPRGRQARLTRRTLVAALHDLDREYTRLTAPATHAKEKP